MLKKSNDFLLMKIVKPIFETAKAEANIVMLRKYAPLLFKLDGVGPVDNRLSND